MNESIKKLHAIAAKDSRKIIGLMSGTSLDGLDIALCEVKGNGINTKLSVLKFITVKYEAGFIQAVKEIFSKRQVELEKICLLNEWIAIQHASMINNCLHEWNTPRESIDLIASHGQTIYHAPKHMHQHKNFPNGTLQIGDGDHIAVKTGIITISDFRQKHIGRGRRRCTTGGIRGFYLIPGKRKQYCFTEYWGHRKFHLFTCGGCIQ